MERRQQMAAKQVLVVLERLGLDLAGAHVEPSARPDVEGRVALLERELLGRLAVDPSLDLGDDAPALGFGEDGRPALAGEPESPRQTPPVDHDPEPEARVRAVLERPDVDRSLDGAPGAWGSHLFALAASSSLLDLSQFLELDQPDTSPWPPVGLRSLVRDRCDRSNAAMASATTFGSKRSRARGPSPSRIAPSSRWWA